MNGLNAVWTTYAVDGLAIAVVVVFALTSLKKGFVRCLFGFVSGFLAIVFALLFMRSVIEWTDGLFGLQQAMEEGLIKAFSKMDAFSIDVSNAGLESALDGKVPAFLQGIIIDNVGDSTLAPGTTIAMLMGSAVAKLGATLIAFIVLFLMIKFLLKLLSRVLSSVVEKIPLVGSLNSLLGFAVGILEGFLIVCVAVAVLSLIPSESMTAFFDECIFIKWLYNANPLYTVFSWFIS
jgi:uncharacterized membrane protein required for colicin V production